MERGHCAPVATLYAPGIPPSGGEAVLGETAARHATVRRLSVGDEIRVTDGAGAVAPGTIRRLTKRDMVVDLRSAGQISRPPLLEVLAPVADRDRMLWLAEKCAELSVTSWQPVIFARSRSVVPRGQGEAFAAKVRARMIAALEQSAGAWLPEIRCELPLDEAVATVRAPARYVLARSGARLDAAEADSGAAIVFGPEGGIEPDEHALLRATGWKPVALAPTTLRFETAGIATFSILRAGSTTLDREG